MDWKEFVVWLAVIGVAGFIVLRIGSCIRVDIEQSNARKLECIKRNIYCGDRP